MQEKDRTKALTVMQINDSSASAPLVYVYAFLFY